MSTACFGICRCRKQYTILLQKIDELKVDPSLMKYSTEHVDIFSYAYADEKMYNVPKQCMHTFPKNVLVNNGKRVDYDRVS